MVNIKMFRHPKYYKELRKRNKSDQAISRDASTEDNCVRPGPGLKRQAIEETVPHNDIEEASSKHQASSSRRQAFEPTCSSSKRQASSPRQQASSVKPQAASSVIRVPRYKNTEEVFLGKGPRAFT
jgi:hypothetical protein